MKACEDEKFNQSIIMGKRQLFVIIVLLINGFNSFAQGEKWDFRNPDGSSSYALHVLAKNSLSDSININPFLNSFGAIIIKNGIYDFRIDGHKYFFYKVDSITRNEVFISNFRDSSEKVSFNLQQDVVLVLFSLNEGRVGWPRKQMTSKEYNFRIVEQDRFCVMPAKKVCLNEDCSKYIISNYRYMTANSIGKPIYFDADNWYMLDGRIKEPIYRK